jgi:hypothetical protein
LKEWIQAGGRLLAIAPPGIHDPWGRPSGKLLSAVFPGVQWDRTPIAPREGGSSRRSVTSTSWEPHGRSLPARQSTHPTLDGMYRGRLGEGELLLFTNVDSNTRPEADAALLDFIKDLMPRQPFHAAMNRFELTLRHDERNRRYILTALNGDLHQRAEDEVHLRLPVRRAVDVENALALPIHREGDESRLPLALAPGEGAVIELRE